MERSARYSGKRGDEMRTDIDGWCFLYLVAAIVMFCLFAFLERNEGLLGAGIAFAFAGLMPKTEEIVIV